jgi:proteasome lid subunit RPN8/RPN11
VIARFVLPRPVRASIETRARSAYPRECCGLIEGIRDGARAIAMAVHPANNLAYTDDSFQIDPADHARAQRAAREAGHAIIGCYHSHPDGNAEPSPRDLESASEREFIWLIVSLARTGETGIAAFAHAESAFRIVDISEFALA